MVPFPLGLGSAHAPRVARAEELDESPMVNRRALHGEVKNHQVRLLGQGGAWSERQAEAIIRGHHQRPSEEAIKRQVTALACSACTTKNLARYAYQSEPKSELPPISSLMSSCNGFP